MFKRFAILLLCLLLTVLLVACKTTKTNANTPTDETENGDSQTNETNTDEEAGTGDNTGEQTGGENNEGDEPHDPHTAYVNGDGGIVLPYAP